VNKGDEEDAEQEKNDPIIAHLWRVTSVEGGRGNIILMLFHPNIQNTDVSCPLFFSFWQFPNFKFLFFVRIFFCFFPPPRDSLRYYIWAVSHPTRTNKMEFLNFALFNFV